MDKTDDNHNIVIFCAGHGARLIYQEIKNSTNVLAFIDNDESLWGHKFIDCIKIQPPNSLLNMDFDIVLITALSQNSCEEIQNQLREFDIPSNKIKISKALNWSEARINFVRSFAEYAYNHGIGGGVAECGVYRGEFAKEINRLFPDRKLYLFDTFDGFDARDVYVEHKNDFTIRTVGKFSDTSIDKVMEKMPHPDNCIIKKGFFPDTFDIQNEQFLFVNLDTDMYNPIKSGLEIFYPLLVKGGIIVVHDYFNINYKGVKQAVDEFASVRGLSPFPIGDTISIAFIK